MVRKVEDCCGPFIIFLWGELGPHLTECRLGRGLPPYGIVIHPAVWSQQTSAVRPSWRAQRLKISNVKNSRWWRAPSGKNRKIAISPQQFDQSPQNSAQWRSFAFFAVTTKAIYRPKLKQSCRNWATRLLAVPIGWRTSRDCWTPFWFQISESSF